MLRQIVARPSGCTPIRIAELKPTVRQSSGSPVLHQLIKRIREGLSWRWQCFRAKRFLNKTFRNGSELYLSWRKRSVCDTATFRDGLVILHPPGETGFAGLLLEIFHRCVYTGNFYQPKPGDFVVDAGANIGAFAIHIHRLCPQTKVVAYEPFPDNFAFLKKNLNAANATNVTAHCKALGARTGSSVIQKVGQRSQDHRVIDSQDVQNEGDDDLTKVEMVPFSHLFSEANGRSISLLKCDIEGSELELFRSATPEQLQRIDRVAIEFHDHLVPGTSMELMKILQPTHHVHKQTDSELGYGMLYGTRRAQ